MKYKTDKGVAGLTIMLSLVVMLFIIGLIVMIFSLMGTELKDATYSENTAGTATNESNTRPTDVGINLTANGLRDGSCSSITGVINGTAGNDVVIVITGNFSQTGCLIKNLTSMATYTSTLRFTYPYTYSADNTATNAINDTIEGLSGVTDWFGIFVVIGAMIVLILLTVIIISAIRGSGMVGGGEGSGKPRSIGTA